MITTSQIYQVFNSKLAKTNSFDEAFNKAIWVAYTEGVLDGLTTTNPENIIDKTKATLEKSYAS